MPHQNRIDHDSTMSLQMMGCREFSAGDYAGAGSLCVETRRRIRLESGFMPRVLELKRAAGALYVMCMLDWAGYRILPTSCPRHPHSKGVSWNHDQAVAEAEAVAEAVAEARLH